ncbi:MAG TPA: dTDP-glucose 4,6-dehydratase [Planctomycetes bacterium]|nr:dTDP-glucose 4,6-dehydratase [Fuerstiella sp.]HIK94835.1 dTDP-glucose 4,6-dehydratase [Planctomycetota bacterium]
MKTLLVTGGAGFIGSCFIRRAVRRVETTIINLDKLTYAGNPDSLPSSERQNQRLVQGDIGDRELVRSLLSEHRPVAVVNFAAESHVDRSIDGPLEFVQTNVVGTCRLLEEVRAYVAELDDDARQAFRFLHVSTDEVYGSLGDTGLFTEDTPYSPNSPYSASKAASDHFVRAYLHTYGLPTVMTNCSNNYGPYQFPEKLIPLMILNAMEGKPLPVYGDGMNVRDWLFVEDHCKAIETVLDNGRIGECYNVGGNNEQTNIDIVTTICRTVDRLCPGLPHAPCESLITYVTDRPGHDRRYAIDASKIKNELGWEPTQDFASGIEQTVQWYVDNSNWVERVQSGDYRRERLGLESK